MNGLKCTMTIRSKYKDLFDTIQILIGCITAIKVLCNIN